MKRPILYAFVLSGLFLLVLSCGKDTDINGTTFPLVVSAKSLESPGTIRMFTKDGEIKDAASIARFVGNVRMHGQNIFEESFESDEDNKITFLSKDSLVFAGMELRYGITEIQPGKFIITRDFQSMAHGPLYGMSVTEDIWRLGANHSPLEKNPAPVAGFFLTGKETRVGYGSFKSFKLPILLFKLKRQVDIGGSVSIQENAGNRFDEFDEEFIFTLKNQDTLAIQQHYVLFK